MCRVHEGTANTAFYYNIFCTEKVGKTSISNKKPLFIPLMTMMYPRCTWKKNVQGHSERQKAKIDKYRRILYNKMGDIYFRF